MNDLLIGIVLIAIGCVLVFIARPNKSGQHPYFLRFESSMVLYPPVIMIFLVIGAAEVLTWLFAIER
ncbi:MAG TPA: hypothetical protein VFP60_05975 [Pseudolabrys sp.]|nr:hypothetical protein [Pseudolabrys sp.]